MNLIVAVDFDGTIVEHRYPNIGDPIPGALEWLRHFESEGIRLILWTMRSGDTLDAAVKYLKTFGVSLWGVNKNPEQSSWTASPKAYAPIYVDDAALGCPLLPRDDGERAAVDWSKVGPWVCDLLGVDEPDAEPAPRADSGGDGR